MRHTLGVGLPIEGYRNHWMLLEQIGELDSLFRGLIIPRRDMKTFRPKMKQVVC